MKSFADAMLWLRRALRLARTNSSLNRLLLPKQKSQPAQRASSLRQRRPASRILLVESNPIARETLRICLESAGHSVLEATGGEGASQLASEEAPDLVLQNICVRNIQCVQLLLDLRRQADCLGIPTILYSEDVNQLIDVRELGLEQTGFLVKPFHPSHFLHSIEFHLDPDCPPAGRRSENREMWLFDRSKAPASASETRGDYILAVEDVNLKRKLLAPHFEELGFRTMTVATGPAAFECAWHHPPAAIVSEVLTPGMSGYELCLALRKVGQSIPIILTSSGFVEEPDWRLAQSVAASAFTLRTPDLANVTDALRACLPANAQSLIEACVA